MEANFEPYIIFQTLDKLNWKLKGYYNFYGMTGNTQSLKSFWHQVKQLLFKWLNKRSQRKSYIWKGFMELMNEYRMVKPPIRHAL